MKRIKCLMLLIALFIFMPVVNAGSAVISTDCPNTVEPNKNFNCKVYASITGSEASYTIGTSKGTGAISLTTSPEDIGPSILDVGSKGAIVSVSLKSGGSGTGTVTIPINFSFDDGTSQNAVATKTIKVASGNNNLNSLTVNGTKVNGFNSNITSYNVSTSSTTIAVGALKSHAKAVVSGTGNKSLKCGENIITVSVKAENGNVKNYVLKVNRTCSNNAKLRGITLSSGTLNPDFSDSVYDYTVKLDKTVDKISITGVKSVSSQKITGEVKDKEINFGKTNFTLVVESENGEKANYNIVVERDDTRDKTNKLSSLSLSSGTIKFDPETFDYETKVLYEVDKIDVVATPEKETSKVEVVGNDKLEVGENTIKIKVKSETGSESTYIIKVTRLKEGETLGDNAKIKNIVVNGYKLNFDYDKRKYKLVIKREKKLNIIVVMDEKDAKYEITGNKNLKDGSKIKILTKSADESAGEEYVINIIKPNYTVYYVLGGILLATLILVPLLVYFKYVKPKKSAKDINGNAVEDASVEEKRTVLDSSSSEETKEEIKKEKENTEGLTGIKCPVCSRELLGMPDECPYCKSALKYNFNFKKDENK